MMNAAETADAFLVRARMKKSDIERLGVVCVVHWQKHLPIIVIIVVIVLGGLYFWGQRIEKQKEISTPVTPTETTVADQPATNSQSSDATVQVMQKQSSSDDLTSIQTDLNATNMSTLGTEDVGSASAASASQ